MNRKLICSAVAIACLGAAGSLYAQNKQQVITTVVKITGIAWFVLAFVVLMGGVTVALGLGLWRADYGVLALPYVLALGGASAGLRFAWLDREAGRDG